MLALSQSGLIRQQLACLYPDRKFEIKKIKTTGDKFLDAPLAPPFGYAGGKALATFQWAGLAKIGGRGLFTKEIDEALVKGEIDLAVHSMKDIPLDMRRGIALGAITRREDPHDALISLEGDRLSELPKGALVGTSSLRRRAQLLAYRRDLKIVDLRGNLDTRIKKLGRGDFDAIVLAVAGLVRMNWFNKITEVIKYDVMLPAVGQGALGITIREGDKDIIELISCINDDDSNLAISVERALLKALGGGCQVPIGAVCEVGHSQISLKAAVASPDGKKIIREDASCVRRDVKSLAGKVAVFVSELKSSAPHAAQVYIPFSLFLLYFPVKGLSV